MDWSVLSGTEGVLHDNLGGLAAVLSWVVAGVELLAIAVMLIGTARFLVGFVSAEVQRAESARAHVINRERVELGRYILSGLELLIVSDIIHTALSLALADLVYLALLVAIRSAISYFLDREIREIKEDPDR
ncbi:DUF1622 domain-containing protein [Rhodobacteraceae bacterium W635]|uniref:DUF1622 domain-containing protein n=1 Tax=Nioella halotolerans TaxID=2303578 RepID=UPI000E3DD055|nr:DUF1622 domain-containing protein [Rhodobacteraceae bacterium W635]